ncbi:MAG: hypothetical protein K2M04_03845 [Muribaculaceae bacterium]|nr:hypothetical protein [Muribaculaceae bacterium]
MARHYQPGKFSSKKAWLRLGLWHEKWWSPAKVAACVAITIGLTATAAYVVNTGYFTKEYGASEQPAVEQSTDSNPMTVKVIDFDNAPLPTVLAEIKGTYGADVENIPANAENYRLTLLYEGTAADLIETINEILGTDLIIAE